MVKRFLNETKYTYIFLKVILFHILHVPGSKIIHFFKDSHGLCQQSFLRDSENKDQTQVCRYDTLLCLSFDKSISHNFKYIFTAR